MVPSCRRGGPGGAGGPVVLVSCGGRGGFGRCATSGRQGHAGVPGRCCCSGIFLWGVHGARSFILRASGRA